MPPLFPPWAWGSGYKGSPLAHVNRRYHWHMGRLRMLLSLTHGLLRDNQKSSTIIDIEDEMRRVTGEFQAWKEANAQA